MLPIASIEKVFAHVGAQRVSEDAKAALRDILIEYAEVKARESILFTSHAGRKTVKARDVHLLKP
ncbi:MAG: histone family protein [Nanobdellota archaeon]